MYELLEFIRYLLELYWWVIIASVVMSWLVAFGVLNAYNPMVRSIWQALNAVTEPLLRPIRNMLPNMGAIDISPVILLIALTGIKDFFIPYLQRTIA